MAEAVASDVRSLADMPPQDLLSVSDAVLTKGAPGGPFGPILDGELVTGEPWEAAAAAGNVALVIGSTREEYRGIGGPLPGDALAGVAEHWNLPPEASETYLKETGNPSEALTALLSDALVRMPALWAAEAHATAGGRTWLYDFAWAGPTLGAAHGIDLPFVFGLPHSRFATRFFGAEPPPVFTGLSTAMAKAWTGFAATGDPGWPRFETESRTVRVWDAHPHDEAIPEEGTRALWQRPADRCG